MDNDNEVRDRRCFRISKDFNLRKNWRYRVLGLVLFKSDIMGCVGRFIFVLF